MKKPKITYNPLKVGDSETLTEGGSVIINGKELFEDDCAELISEMIDALIKAHEDLVEWNDCIPASNETQDIIEQIEQALKKAGVE